jgi:hypothetical protein
VRSRADIAGQEIAGGGAPSPRLMASLILATGNRIRNNGQRVGIKV